MKVQKKIRLRVKEFFDRPCHPLCFGSVRLAGKFPVQIPAICRIQLFYPRKKCSCTVTPDDLETGETVKTPRGTFHVTAMSREQIEAAGYGFHHQSDDGKYLIMGNGTRAFAVAAEQAQRDNPLKTAEQTTEQNGNMIDGIINNTPTVDELEAKVKAGEQISLVDLANAVKADKERGKGAKPEKKPSIRAQLRADKEKAQKKNAKQKSQDLERS